MHGIASSRPKETATRNRSRVFTGTASAGSPDRVSQLLDAWRLARLARANLLLIGPAGVIEHLVDALLDEQRQPTAACSWCGERLVLPPIETGGTLILHNVGALDRRDQRRLFQWLDQAAGQMQVISTTSASLLRRIEAGDFYDRLYYRLNTICVDITN